MLVLLLEIDPNKHTEETNTDGEIEKSVSLEGYEKIEEDREKVADTETTYMLKSTSSDNASVGKTENLSQKQKKKRADISKALQKMLRPWTSLFKVPSGVQNKTYYLFSMWTLIFVSLSDHLIRATKKDTLFLFLMTVMPGWKEAEGPIIFGVEAIRGLIMRKNGGQTWDII